MYVQHVAWYKSRLKPAFMYSLRNKDKTWKPRKIDYIDIILIKLYLNAVLLPAAINIKFLQLKIMALLITMWEAQTN